jgi:hypothetical protein
MSEQLPTEGPQTLPSQEHGSIAPPVRSEAGLKPLPANYEHMARQYETPAQLRNAVYAEMQFELEDRMINNPMPTNEELNIGAYKEQLEPQVRDAVMDMRAKGYNTHSSGFAGKSYEEQRLDLDRPLSDEIVTLLRENGFGLGIAFFFDDDNPDKGTWQGESAGSIVFKPEKSTDLAEMKSKWDKLASILPDLGSSAPPATHYNAERFRRIPGQSRVRDYSWTLK